MWGSGIIYATPHVAMPAWQHSALKVENPEKAVALNFKEIVCCMNAVGCVWAFAESFGTHRGWSKLLHIILEPPPHIQCNVQERLQFIVLPFRSAF